METASSYEDMSPTHKPHNDLLEELHGTMKIALGAEP